MVVKVITTKKIKEGKSREALVLLKRLRFHAYEQPGYISGEELIGYNDPQKILIINMWHSVENWEKSQESAGRADIEADLAPLLDQPTEHEVFLLGTNIVRD